MSTAYYIVIAEGWPRCEEALGPDLIRSAYTSFAAAYEAAEEAAYEAKLLADDGDERFEGQTYRVLEVESRPRWATEII